MGGGQTAELQHTHTCARMNQRILLGTHTHILPAACVSDKMMLTHALSSRSIKHLWLPWQPESCSCCDLSAVDHSGVSRQKLSCCCHIHIQLFNTDISWSILVCISSSVSTAEEAAGDLRHIWAHMKHVCLDSDFHFLKGHSLPDVCSWNTHCWFQSSLFIQDQFTTEVISDLKFC